MNGRLSGDTGITGPPGSYYLTLEIGTAAYLKGHWMTEANNNLCEILGRR
jgi:hypothetical protein